jgi:hypothetical protein
MKSTTKLLVLSIAPSIILVVLLVVGFVAGRYVLKRPFDKEIQATSRSFTLGSLLNDEQKKRIIPVYHEGDKVLKQIDNISWAVPNTPTPFVGTAPMPGQHGVAHINMMQFRAKKEIEIPKPKDAFRIFITGGSTAYGSGAPSEERTIAGYLNKIISNRLSPLIKKRYEVFTMANPAWASTHERIVIENKLSELEPDMTISLSGNNDVHWGRLGRNVLWFRSYDDEFYLNLIRKVYKLTNQPDIPEITHIEPAEIPPHLVVERLVKNVKLSSFVLSQEDINYIFVLQPTLAVTRKRLTKREQELLRDQDYFRECYAQIDIALKNLNGKNYQYVNLSHIFDSMDDHEDVFLDSYHFGDKGNELIAENIFLHIKDRITQ